MKDNRAMRATCFNVIRFMTIFILMVLAVGWWPFEVAYAETQAQLENELSTTRRAINRQHDVIRQAENNYQTTIRQEKNAKRRYAQYKSRRDRNPDSQAVAVAADRAFDDVIRAQGARKKAWENLKKQKEKLYELQAKKKELANKMKKVSTTTPSLDNVIEAGTIPGFYEDFYRSRYKNKASQNNKEDKSIESKNRGGVDRNRSGPITLEIPVSP